MEIPVYVQTTLEKLLANDYSAYLVGGCVRDMIRNTKPHDYDVTTNAMPEKIMSSFKGSSLILAGLKHGTVGVVYEKNVVEVTTHRIDGEYSDNRHPDKVAFTENLIEDLARRDFTINAIAMNLNGDITDPYNGRLDIENKIIRSVGNPEKRFEEDALRILRAVRFAATLGFEIEPETKKAIHEYKYLLANIARERLQTELFKTICGDYARKTLIEYSDVFEEFMPISFDDIENTSVDMEKLPPDASVRFAYIFRNEGLDSIENMLYSLKMSKRVIIDTLFFIRNFYFYDTASEIDIKLAISKHGNQLMKRLLGLWGVFSQYDETYNAANAVFDKIAEEKCCLFVRDMKISGTDVRSMGVTDRCVGLVLSELLILVIKGEVENEKEKLMAQIPEIKRRIL